MKEGKFCPRQPHFNQPGIRVGSFFLYDIFDTPYFINDPWTSYSRKQATPQSIKKISKSIRNMHVEFKVKLADAKIKMHELLNLRVGDIICTQKKVETPLLISVEGIPKFWGHPGTYKGYTAVQINETIEDPTDIVAQD
ncbi:hypothetical protein FACS18942_00320 [Planctomycetales bacterium]|nr:hypothetical protein FACS18942_00320 [Planctomycetales bacterium]